MNIEETKKAIEVMQAFVDGKTVQAKIGDGWMTVDVPLWEWFGVSYRIKPEPKEIWVNEYSDLYGGVFDTKEAALKSAYGSAIRKAVHYREVIEE